MIATDIFDKIILYVYIIKEIFTHRYIFIVLVQDKYALFDVFSVRLLSGTMR